MLDSVPDPKTKSWSGRRILGLAAWGVAFLVAVIAFIQVNKSKARAHQASKAQRERIENRRWQLAMRDDSAFKAAFNGQLASENHAKIQDLIRRGDRRLSDNDQIRKFALLGAMLNAMPEEQCAHDDWWERAMLELDSAGIEEYVAVSFAAMQAEIRGTSPALRTDSAAVAWAIHTIDSLLTPDEHRVFSKKMTPRGEDAHCRAARVLYGRISTLPRSQQAGYARAVTTIEASRYVEGK